MAGASSVLIVSGTADHHHELSTAISSSGLLATSCKTLETAQSLVGEHKFSMMFCEDGLSPDLCAVIRKVSLSASLMPIIVVSRRDDWQAYLDTLRAGAFDCVVLPAAPGEVDRVVRAALRTFGQPVVWS